MKMCTIHANKRIISLVLLLVFMASLLSAVPAKAQSEGGIAISGSFYRHHYKLVPGESFSSPQIDIVVFNNYDRAIDVKLTANIPEGVVIDIDQKLLSIKPHDSQKLSVGLTVGEEVVPGEYEIGISADVQPDVEEGIAVVGSAELRTKLTVFGESGDVSVKVVTNEGEPFAGNIYLFLKQDNEVSAASYYNGSVFDDRLIPGEYLAQVYYNGEEVATDDFELAVDENKEVVLVVKTVSIFGLAATPQYDEQKKNIASARITYTIKNVYKPLKNISAVLNVYHRDKLIEELEMFTIPELEVGTQDNRYTYMPPAGWKDGRYNFTVSIYSNGDLFQNQSNPAELEVQTAGMGGMDWLIIVVVVVVLAVAAGLYFWKYRHKDKTAV